MPGDPSGVSLSPPPPGPRLYRARALLPPSSSSPRAAVGSARGGGLGTPGRGEALFASLLFPHAALLGTLKPVHASSLSLLSRSLPTSGPSPAPLPLFVVAPARLRRSEGSAGPPSLQLGPLQDPETCRPHFCPPSTISTSCARYAGEQGEKKAGKQEALRVFRLCLLSSAFGEPLPTLTFWGLGEKNPEVCSSRAGWCLMGREKEQGGRKGRRERL